MTFKERYNSESTWQGRVMIMELYHLAMSQQDKTWTISNTATHFQCSIGLVSENLKLGHAFHVDEQLMKCESRQTALKKLRNGR